MKQEVEVTLNVRISEGEQEPMKAELKPVSALITI